MSTTGRTIQEILAIRKRARELWVQERTLAVVNARQEIDQLQARFMDTEPGWDKLAKMKKARNVAKEALVLAEREIQAQQGHGETVKFDAASPLQFRFYAAVLMCEQPDLTAEDALDQARADEDERFEEYYQRVHADDVIEEA